MTDIPRDEQIARAVAEACAKVCEKISEKYARYGQNNIVSAISACRLAIRALPIADLVAALPKEEPVANSQNASPESDGSYWLIERGSPCEWWVRGQGNQGQIIYEEWTTDASKALRFSEWGSKHHAQDLERWGVKGPLRATQHIDCDAAPVAQPDAENHLTREQANASVKRQEEELKDGDRICAALGLVRTAGGRLPIYKILAAIRSRKCL